MERMKKEKDLSDIKIKIKVKKWVMKILKEDVLGINKNYKVKEI